VSLKAGRFQAAFVQEIKEALECLSPAYDHTFGETSFPLLLTDDLTSDCMVQGVYVWDRDRAFFHASCEVIARQFAGDCIQILEPLCGSEAIPGVMTSLRWRYGPDTAYVLWFDGRRDCQTNLPDVLSEVEERWLKRFTAWASRRGYLRTELNICSIGGVTQDVRPGVIVNRGAVQYVVGSVYDLRGAPWSVYLP
jgi:hypothetical protein